MGLLFDELNDEALSHFLDKLKLQQAESTEGLLELKEAVNLNNDSLNVTSLC